MNSEPRVKNAATDRVIKSAAAVTVSPGLSKARRSIGSYSRSALVIIGLLFSSRSFRKSALSAGMKVRLRTRAAQRARITVYAIGLNILPSIPTRATIGI